VLEGPDSGEGKAPANPLLIAVIGVGPGAVRREVKQEARQEVRQAARPIDRAI